MSIITKWQPGKLYQPGAVAIPNEGGAVTQVTPGNADFESGDSGWTKQDNWSIDQVDAFQGTWSAAYSGEAGSGLVIGGEWFGGKAYKTTDGATFVRNTTNTNGTLNSPIVIGSASLLVAVDPDVSQSEASYSTDGVTWTAATTVPWDTFDVDMTVEGLYSSGDSLFMVQGGTKYWLTSDGITWTEYSHPGGSGLFMYLETISSVTYGVTSSGRVYSSSDGMQTWSTVNAISGLGTVQAVLKVGSTYYFTYAAGAADIRWYTATDITVSGAWTRDTAVETAIEAELGTIMGNGVRLAYSGGTFVIAGQDTGSAAQTDYLATSTDGLAWTARSSFGGRGLRYSATRGQFVQTGGGLGATSAYLHTSADGITWARVAYETAATDAGGYSAFNTADLTATDPIFYVINDTAATVVPGQTVRVRALAKTAANGTCFVGIRWYDDVAAVIETEYDSTPVGGASTGWRETYFIGTAPANAATCAVVVGAQGSGAVRVDNIIWEYFNQAGACEFTYEATQATAAFSGTVEPAWPSVLGNTVVDNAVTWTARKANCITYEAKAILKSGSTEPTWPTEVDASVADNTILWIAEDQRVKDENCPNTKQVAIAAGKVFAGDDDIVAFSATVNPLDWTTVDDSGYLPFGLNTYGSQPITALGLYRSNLVVWNTKAFQMWQVDEDPQNHALLDAVPIGNPFYKSGQAVSNDLVFLTASGIRSMGIAGASTNLEAGIFGKQVDPLVKAAIAGIADNDDIIALYYPGEGQYWLIFEDEAFVLTMNGGKKDMSWSRYTFPSAIDDWSIQDQDLYLRSGDKVWKFDEDALQDDVGGTPTDFEGRVWWPYLDFGAIGQDKELAAFDTVADGEYAVSFGYDQGNDALATTPYTITDGDTIVGDPVPYELVAPSIQMRLTFAGNQSWEWSATTLYLQDIRKG